ncbi:hypothetical protein EJ03DRAFT_175372 [Teratosphaeria nubilosa]|uniref:Uncharacterized protein n=1 Tax=Teratosphaeria nubilosa TaxID=161662 RepID=A0A6G1L246_9PEZI|nr:hypothetical protein EJ03DRAFT_175372 [Teratosphaeria nubilosa]
MLSLQYTNITSMKTNLSLSTVLVLLATQASAKFKHGATYARCRCADTNDQPRITLWQSVCEKQYAFPAITYPIAAWDTVQTGGVVVGSHRIGADVFARRSRSGLAGMLTRISGTERGEEGLFVPPSVHRRAGARHNSNRRTSIICPEPGWSVTKADVCNVKLLFSRMRVQSNCKDMSGYPTCVYNNPSCGGNSLGSLDGEQQYQRCGSTDGIGTIYGFKVVCK